MTAFTIVFCLLYFLFGACLFSFAGVVIDRVPAKEPIARGRSHCGACGHSLAARDLIPVASYLFLRGRCRYCGARIPPKALVLELLGGALALLCVFRFGGTLYGVPLPSGMAAYALVVFTLLCCLSGIDLAVMELPDGLVLALALCLPLSLLLEDAALLSRLIGALCVSVPMAALALLIPGAFGGGDIKLMAAAGLLLGWRQTLLAAFLGILTGGGWACWLLLSRRAGGKAHIAFGPFLCLGIAVSLLWGEELISWYLSLFA